MRGVVLSENSRVKYSFLMALHESERVDFFEDTVNSCMQQTLKPNEIIIICDGLLSESLSSYVETLEKNKLFTIKKLSLNKGLAYSLNLGLALSRNEMIARIDTDDINKLNRIELQLKKFEEKKDISILGTFADIIDENGSVVGFKEMPIYHKGIKDKIWANPIIHPSVMFKKSEIIKIFGYNEKLRRRQDYDLWFRCIDKGLLFENINQPLIQYRRASYSYKRNNIRNAFNQFSIGVRGGLKSNSPWYIYPILLLPLCKSIFPVKVQVLIDKIGRYFDPRR